MTCRSHLVISRLTGYEVFFDFHFLFLADLQVMVIETLGIPPLVLFATRGKTLKEI